MESAPCRPLITAWKKSPYMIVRPHETNEKLKAQTFFLSETWLAANDAKLKIREIRNEEGQVSLAHYGFYSYSKFGVPMIITPPMAPHSGLQINYPSENIVSRQTLTKRVLRAMASDLSERKAYIDLALPPFIKDVQPFKELAFDIDIAYTYLLNLGPSPDEIRSSMSSERRKNIRDAERLNFEVVLGGEEKASLDLILNTLKSRGVKPRAELLTKLINSDSTDVFTVSVFSGGEILATSLIGLDQNCGYYLAGGTSKSQSLAGPLALYQAILKCRDKGLKTFDFLGSSVPAIERYFRGFGGELTPYFRVRKNTGLIDFLKSTKDRLGT